MTDAEGQRTAVSRGTLKTIKPWDRSTVGLEGTSAPISPTPQPHTRAPQVQVGVELEANTRLQDTTFAFGYQLNLPQANVVFRGLLDSNWSVGAVLEKKLPPLPVTLALGAFLNHWKNRFHCGFSVIVG